MSDEIIKKQDIEFHKGNTHILLIAPHGVETTPYDDIATAELTRQIRGYLGCSAVINTTYREPEGNQPKKRNNGKPSKKKEVLDLNRVSQAEQVNEFTNKIKEVVDAEGLTYVFWIHGIDDGKIKKIKKDAQCLIGYGQPDTNIKEDTHYTAEEESVKSVLKEFNERKINTILAPETSIYCGWNESYMNQWFRVKGYDFTKVQSIQLEFIKAGCRDNDESIKSTAKRVADAISALIIPKTVHAPLVERAYDKLASIFSENYERALMEAGQYIVRTFYGDEKNIEDQPYDENMVLDQTTIENARKKESPKKESLHQLLQKLDSDKTSSTPSKAWIYNAVNLIVQYHDMKKELKNRFYTYRNLLLSHKLCLLYAKNISTKRLLIDEAGKNRLTVNRFKERLAELEPPDPARPITLLTLLKRPEEFVKEENAEKFSLSILKDEQSRTLNKLKIITEAQYGNIQNDIDRLFQDLQDRKRYLERYDNVRTNIEKAIQYKQKALPQKKLSKSKRKPPTVISGRGLAQVDNIDEKELRRSIKNNEWTISKNNVNFSTGCSNACVYCYGRYMPYANKLSKEAKKQGKEFKWGKPTIRLKDVDKNRYLRNGRIGFPTSHDITLDNLEHYLTVLDKLLTAGNDVMIITKPVLECIQAICEKSVSYKDKILFRFTITAKSNEVLKFWEPNASSYDHRIRCLKYAFDKGFQTSVSIEPMLEYSRAQEMIDEMMPFVTDAIWFGKMNHIKAFDTPDKKMKAELEKVQNGHSDENIKRLYSIYKDNPKIKWKLAYKELLGIPLPPAPGMDI